jgi:hypothetical protein
MDLKGIVSEAVDWIQLNQDRFQRRVVSTNLQVPENEWNFFLAKQLSAFKAGLCSTELSSQCRAGVGCLQLFINNIQNNYVY